MCIYWHECINILYAHNVYRYIYLYISSIYIFYVCVHIYVNACTYTQISIYKYTHTIYVHKYICRCGRIPKVWRCTRYCNARAGRRLGAPV